MVVRYSTFKSTFAMCAALLCVTPVLHAADPNAPQSIHSSSHPGEWSSTELQHIIKADDLKISPLREDGITYGTPTWIWCVEVEGNLYVCAYHGKDSSWYKATVRNESGRIIAAGETRDVTFRSVEGSINDRIDQAYTAKYSSSPYVADMISNRARSATVQISPVSR